VTNDRPTLPARRPRPGSPAVASDLGLSPRLVTPGEVFDSSLSPWKVKASKMSRKYALALLEQARKQDEAESSRRPSEGP